MDNLGLKSRPSMIGGDNPDAPDYTEFGERLQIFEHVVSFFCQLFKRPDAIENANCRESYKKYVPHYYAKLFGEGIYGLTHRHLKWLHRLDIVLSLRKGKTILDFGGGYGVDSILLAALGYHMIFYEITPHHIGVCQELKRLWEEHNDPLSIRMVLGTSTRGHQDRMRKNAEAIGEVDSVFLNEVAHHVEPVSDVFEQCAHVLSRGSHLFLLEPNYWNPSVQAYFVRVRGLKTVEARIDEKTGEQYLYGRDNIRPAHRWCYLAKVAGFELRGSRYIVPYFLKAPVSLNAPWRRMVECTPVLKTLVSTHISFDFEKKVE